MTPSMQARCPAYAISTRQNCKTESVSGKSEACPVPEQIPSGLTHGHRMSLQSHVSLDEGEGMEVGSSVVLTRVGEGMEVGSSVVIVCEGIEVDSSNVIVGEGIEVDSSNVIVGIEVGSSVVIVGIEVGSSVVIVGIEVGSSVVIVGEGIEVGSSVVIVGEGIEVGSLVDIEVVDDVGASVFAPESGHVQTRHVPTKLKAGVDPSGQVKTQSAHSPSGVSVASGTVVTGSAGRVGSLVGAGEVSAAAEQVPQNTGQHVE